MTRIFQFLALCIVFAAGVLSAQSPSAGQPFQAVHLLWIDGQQPHAEENMVAAVNALNKAITKAGCPACTYHLWKVFESAPGSYNYVQVSDWPSRTVYDKIHNSPDYIAASVNWEKLRTVVKQEVYSRSVSIPLDK